MKLLVVDDASLIRKTIQSYLKDTEIEIIGEATNGVEALEVLQDQRPDIVTLDITMPEMDGLTCLEHMLQIDPDLKVIIVSALAKQATVIRALKMGAKSFINKPFSEEKLITTLTKVIES